MPCALARENQGCSGRGNKRCLIHREVFPEGKRRQSIAGSGKQARKWIPGAIPACRHMHVVPRIGPRFESRSTHAESIRR